MGALWFRALALAPAAVFAGAAVAFEAAFPADALGGAVRAVATFPVAAFEAAAVLVGVALPATFVFADPDFGGAALPADVFAVAVFADFASAVLAEAVLAERVLAEAVLAFAGALPAPFTAPLDLEPAAEGAARVAAAFAGFFVAGAAPFDLAWTLRLFKASSVARCFAAVLLPEVLAVVFALV